MTAKEAREIAFKSNLVKNDFTDLEFVYDQIKKAAEKLETVAPFFGIIPDDMREILERDGFVIRIYGENFPQPMTSIRW